MMVVLRALCWSDGVDDASAQNKRGLNQSGAPFTGNSNCSWGTYSKIATDQARLRMSQAQMTAFAQAATLLNKCGVWPIYSMGNAMNPTVSPERGYPQTMESELTPLLASNASWARFYEFWGWSGADYGIRSALNLTALGVPLVMHAYPGKGGPDDITMAVAMFLIVQTEHCYFGTSVGGKGFTPWDDPACVFVTLSTSLAFTFVVVLSNPGALRAVVSGGHGTSSMMRDQAAHWGTPAMILPPQPGPEASQMLSSRSTRRETMQTSPCEMGLAQLSSCARSRRKTFSGKNWK